MTVCGKCNYINACEQLNYLDVANNCSDLKKYVDEIRQEERNKILDMLNGIVKGRRNNMEEKIKIIVEEYHCSGDELCFCDCEQCKDDLKKELEELVGLAKADAIDEFVRAINSRLLRFVPTDYDDILFIAKNLKEQK